MKRISASRVPAAAADQRIDGWLSGGEMGGWRHSYSDPDPPTDYQAGYHSNQDGDGISAQNEGF